MTTFKDLQHGTVNPFQPDTKAISYPIDKTLEQGVHTVDLITSGTYTLGLWLDDAYVGMFCGNSLTFELANDVYVEDVIIKEYNENGSIESAFIGIRHTEPVGTYPAQSITTSELLSPITQVVAYWDDESAFIAGNDDGSSIEVHNPWATQGSTDHVQGVLDNYEYIPVTARGVYADPAIQLGDTIVSGGQEQVVANVDWVFDGGAIANIETPLTTEENFDDPYIQLQQQQFAKKLTLGDSYQGVSIGRRDGIQMLLSPDGTLENAIGRYYANLTKGMAFQTRPTPNDEWLDWMYFDIDEKIFKLSLYSTTDEVEGMIDGIELNKVWFAYSANANGNPMTETPQPDSRYLGTASAVERPTSYTNYEWSLIRGADGDSGVGIDTVTVTYQNSTSGTTPPTGTWTENPNPIAGQYLWTRTITTYTDSSETETYNVTYQATDGDDGRGIVSTLVEYAISTTPTLPITGWQTTIPPITHGEYLWTRTTINYTSGDPSVSISSSYFGADGTDGERLFMAYADDINGGGFSLTDSEKDYFGLYIGQPPQSTTPSDYDWQPSGFKNEKSIASLELRTDALEIDVETAINQPLAFNLNGELETYEYWAFVPSTFGEDLNFTSGLTYQNNLNFDTVRDYNFLIKDNIDGLSDTMIEFVNDGSATNGRWRVNDRLVSFKYNRVSGSQTFVLNIHQYDENNNFITTATQSFGTSLNEQTFTLNTNTLFVDLEFVVSGVSLSNRLVLSDMMFNGGRPQTYKESPESVKQWARANITVQGGLIQLNAQAIDNVYGDIHNAGVNIDAIDGVSIYGKNFRIMDSDQSRVIMEVISEAGNDLVKITGRLEAGSVGDWKIVDGLISSENDVIQLDSENEIIKFGTNALGRASTENFDYLWLEGLTTGRSVGFGVSATDLVADALISVTGRNGQRAISIDTGDYYSGLYMLGIGNRDEGSGIYSSNFPGYNPSRTYAVADVLDVTHVRIGTTDYTVSRRSSDGALILS